MNDFSFIDNELQDLLDKNLIRELNTIVTANGPWVELSNGERVLQFASNNYLGLANHPDLINASKAAVSKYGVGSSGSRLLSGTLELHYELEKHIADFQGTESSIFFNSGFSANVGVLSALINENDAVYSDELNHASIIDGIKLSRARKFIYQHNNMDDLERLIKENSSKFKRNYIVTDTVFSMDGDLADLKNIGLIAEKYNCINIIDEAHAVGVFGKEGRGLVDELGVSNYFPVRIGTCSKAMGVEGGYCAGPENLIKYLQNKARSFIFSTASSPSVVGTLLKALELVRESDWRREKLWSNANKLHSGLNKNYKLKLSSFKTPIIIVYFNSTDEAVNISKRLFEECHVWAPAIRPPSVSVARIRLSPISPHSEDDINYVIKAFNHVSVDIKVQPLLINK